MSVLCRIAQLAVCLPALGALVAPDVAAAWGTDGHEAIVRLAWRRLTDPCLRGLVDARLATVVVESMAPDRWKGTDPDEAPRHYLNIDYEPEPASFPQPLEAAVQRYGESLLRSLGLVPWRTADMFGFLRDAMLAGDAELVARRMGHLGHYVGDAYSPLHATLNHDGQRTGNVGLHNRWEVQMPRAFRSELEVGAQLLAATTPLPAPDALAGIFVALVSGAALVPDIVRVDIATMGNPRDLYDAHKDMVHRRWVDAAALLASLWQDAYRLAGRPFLAGMPASCGAPATGDGGVTAPDAGAAVASVDGGAPRVLEGRLQGGGGCAVRDGSTGWALVMLLAAALWSLAALARRSERS